MAMKRRILDAANSSAPPSAAVLSSSGEGPALKRARYEEYAGFVDIGMLETNALRVQNSELFAKMRQQRGELQRLGEEAARVEGVMRAWQRLALDLQHSAQQFHGVVHALLSGVTGSVQSSPAASALASALWSAAEHVEDPPVEAARSVAQLTEDARQQLERLLAAVVSGARADSLSSTVAAEARATTLASELQRLRSSQLSAAHMAVHVHDVEERLEREQRNSQRLGLQLAQQQEQHERALREASARAAAAAPVSAGVGVNGSGANNSGSGEEAQQHKEQQQQAAEAAEVLAVREAALEELRRERLGLWQQLEALHAANAPTSADSERRVRESALYRAAEERSAHAEAEAQSARAQLEEARAELNAVRTQRRHDNEQRNRLQQTQLVTQEEKIQAMEARLKKLGSEREALALELEQRKLDKPAPALLRQLTDELAAQSQRLAAAAEAKAAFLERIADLKRTVTRLERGERDASQQTRLEQQERETEALLAQMGEMEAELTRVQHEQTRLLRALAEGEEARLHHTLERAAWSKGQQTAARRGELEREKLTRADERLKLQEGALQQLQAKVAALEQQLRARAEEAQAQTQRADVHERAQNEALQLAQDLALRLEHAHAALHDAQERAGEQHAQRDRLSADLQRTREELAVAQRRAGSATSSGGAGSRSKGSEAYVEQQLEAYKRIVRCSVCNDRQKSAVITRCFHAFCRECVDENLEKRIRKCPGCGVSFGDKDVHPLWL